MNKLPRTFKIFSRHIELRAYIPNNLTLTGIQNAADQVAVEMQIPLQLKPDASSGEMTVSSNRAGLHLAYSYNIYNYNFVGRKVIVSEVITALQSAGWKECKGN